MKKLLLLLLIVPIIGLSQSNFYKGYSAGWKKGYCGESYGCIPPVVPTPPSPRSGFNSYEDGYARGTYDTYYYHAVNALIEDYEFYIDFS